MAASEELFQQIAAQVLDVGKNSFTAAQRARLATALVEGDTAPPILAGRAGAPQPKGLSGKALEELERGMGGGPAARWAHRDERTGALVIPSMTPTEIRAAAKAAGDPEAEVRGEEIRAIRASMARR